MLFMVASALGQIGANCFLQDYSPKTATVPLYKDAVKTIVAPSVSVTIDGTDTLGEISNYIFGNSVAVWVGTSVDNPTMINYVSMLSPTLIRFPGGSWSDVYFWSGSPNDVPDSIPDGTTYNYTTGTFKNTKLWPEIGANQSLTLEGYYDLRGQTGVQGLITINYGYARYGTSAHPVEQAAHLAADWVRYDAGRTEFWEIGNEDSAPWEAGWLIDTTRNKDGQPALMTGDLYGKHFKIFADSMRAAAAEIGNPIYIGGIVIQSSSTYWIQPDQTWNKEFFSEVGDSADFYVIHDYFGNGASSIKGMVDNALTEIDGDITFVRQNIATDGAASVPIALTEWNCSAANQNGALSSETSIANGMQAVAVLCELAKQNAGMSCRWLLANWDTDGMFYYKSPPDSGVPLWNPRPDFYYLYYLQPIIGDHVVDATVSGSSSVYAYATRFSSGHTGVVIVNDGSSNQVVMLNPKSIGVGDRYYVYSLTGVDNSTWPQSVVVNGRGPSPTRWGPLDSLQQIPAMAYPVGDTIEFSSPANSVEYVLIDNGSRIISSVHGRATQTVYPIRLNQNYPNPFNPATTISYELSANSHVTLKVYDVLGREAATLVDEQQRLGEHFVRFDGSTLASGVYLYRITVGSFVDTKKLLLVK
jgi:hypothetical protein